MKGKAGAFVPARLERAVNRGESIVLGTREDGTPAVRLLDDESFILWTMDGCSLDEARMVLAHYFAEVKGYENLIIRNVAMCGVCKRLVESTREDRVSYCACGSLAVGGGHTSIVRETGHPYMERAVFSWVPSLLKSSLLESARACVRIEAIQERTLCASDRAAFFVIGADGGKCLCLPFAARAPWEAAQKARACHPHMNISVVLGAGSGSLPGRGG